MTALKGVQSAGPPSPGRPADLPLLLILCNSGQRAHSAPKPLKTLIRGRTHAGTPPEKHPTGRFNHSKGTKTNVFRWELVERFLEQRVRLVERVSHGF